MKIEVTAEDIKNGVMCSTRRCPIALGFHRATSFRYKDENVRVIGHGIRWGNQRLPLPLKALQFIVDFDSGYVPNPIEFDVPFEELS